MVLLQIDKLYHLRLTMSGILEYEYLTGSKLSALSYSSAEDMTSALFVMLKRENVRLKYPDMIEMLNTSEDKKEIFIATRRAIDEAFATDREADPDAEQTDLDFFSFDDELDMALKELEMLPAEFWALTPAEFSKRLTGYTDKRYRAINDDRALAWYTALFYRLREMPTLDDYLVESGEAKKAKVQSWEQMESMAKMLNAAFGGEYTEVG